MKKIFVLNAFLLLSVLFVHAQTISISEARSKSVGSTVSIKGIAINGNELGTIRYIQDNTGSIAVYDSKLLGVKRGDEISVTGSLSDYNNLLELSGVTSFSVLSTGNPLPAPKEVSLSEGFSEKYEGMLLRFKDISFTESGTFKGNWNYDITDGNTTKQVRIDKNTNIVSTSIPAKAITIVGIMGQYKTSYQLLPRDLADMNFLNSVIEVTKITPNTVGLRFKTNEKGNTIIRYGITTALELGEVSDADVTSNHEITIEGLQPATFYYVQALSANGSDTVKSGLSYVTTASLSSGEIKVYFNNPVDHSWAMGENAVYLNHSLDDTLVAYIKRAKLSIDLAIYNLNNDGLSANISTALNTMANNGVQVRVIADGSTANLGVNQLSTKVAVLKSPQSANYTIMHNKFMVIDAESDQPNEALVWTGSMNLTDEQIHSDPNNVIIITDQALARAYTLEFNEMWGSAGANPNALKSNFGKFKTDNTPHFFNINDKLVELYFSPSDNVNQQIISAIKTADASMYFATMVFTRTDMAYPIIDRHDSGVYVAGIFDNVSGSNSAAYDVLQPAIGSDIKIYSGSGIFHHKYAIIDHAKTNMDLDPMVITGSHNWSSSANTKNDENTLIVHDANVASIYFQEWAQRFADEGGTVFVDLEENTAAKPKTFDVYLIENTLQIDSEAAINQPFVLRLYSLNGKLLMTQKLNINKGSNPVNLSSLNLSNPILIYQISGYKLQQSGKLIKLGSR